MEDAFMLGISQDKWREYDKRCLKERIKDLRSLTSEQLFERYCELYELASEQKLPPALTETRRREKLAMRRKMVKAFRGMDERRNEEQSSQGAS